MALMTSLADIAYNDPCEEGWEALTLARGTDDDTDTSPFPVTDLMKSNGFDDMLWVVDRDYANARPLLRGFAIWCVKRVEHLVTDPDILNAIKAVERYDSPEGCDEDVVYAARERATAAYDRLCHMEWREGSKERYAVSAMCSVADIDDMYGAVANILYCVECAIGLAGEKDMMQQELCRRLDEYKEDE